MAIRGLWKRRHRAGRGDGAGGRDRSSPEEGILLQALEDLAGAARGVIYDVPRAERPLRLPLSPVYLEGSSSWRHFLRVRRALDDGHLTLLLSLRQLPEDERRLVVDWGAAHANTFLLVEPSEPGCDLSDPRSPVAREVLDLCRRAVKQAPPEGQERDRWTARTPLGERLRELYGRWVWWDAPLPEGRSQEEPVSPLAGSSETLSMHLLPLLYDRFPQQSFDVALAELSQTERELFGGDVATARSIFRTRLGMPVLHDPRAADRAVRNLVNLGRMSVVTGGREGVVFGPGHPVPDAMPDEEFERLFMV